MDTRLRVSLALAGIAFASTLALVLLFALNTRDGAAGSTGPASADHAHDGAALFVAKGCIRCHQHAGIETTGLSSLSIGPNLTRYTNDPDFLRGWLADPSAIRPSTTMPDLNLDDSEIERLIAFLNQPK